MLTIHHLYREVKPNVFANTRISSMLDTLKPSKDVISEYVSPMRISIYIVLPVPCSPEHKHDNTIGLTALVGHQYVSRHKQTMDTLKPVLLALMKSSSRRLISGNPYQIRKLVNQVNPVTRPYRKPSAMAKASLTTSLSLIKFSGRKGSILEWALLMRCFPPLQFCRVTSLITRYR